MWTTHLHWCSVPRPLSPSVGPGQLPTPGGMSPPASTGGAGQTKSEAGVTGNACCLVGEGGEGNYNYKKLLFSAAWYMSQALSVSKGELVLVVAVAERGVGLVHKAKNYRLFPPS